MKIFRFFSSLFRTKDQRAIPTKKQVLPNQQTGKIKYFNKKRGYGFIEAENIDHRIFVHITDLKGRARVGYKVQFDLEENKQGYQARNVKSLYKKYAQENS